MYEIEGFGKPNILDNMPTPTIIYKLMDKDPLRFKIIYANDAHFKHHRTSIGQAKQIIGKDFLEVYPDLGSFDFQQTFMNVLKSKSNYSFETTVFDGSNTIEQKVDVVMIPLNKDHLINCWYNKSQETIIRTIKLRNEELEQLTYIASHDLKEPLRTVSNYLKLLTEDYKDRFDEQGQFIVDRIEKAITRMDMLINSVLNYSLIEKQPKEKVDLNLILKEVKQNLEGLIKRKNVIITADKLPTINAGKMEMIQLFQNLISNSIKFSRENVTPQINIEWNKADRYQHEFIFSDNGIGIEKKDQEKVFQMFRKLHNSSQYEGSGLGLAMCKKIVEGLGGNIWVESEKEEGTTFHLTILK